mgnify:CR=1 FL=1
MTERNKAGAHDVISLPEIFRPGECGAMAEASSPHTPVRPDKASQRCIPAEERDPVDVGVISPPSPRKRIAAPGQYGRMDAPRHPVDLYETDPSAVEMLLRHVPLKGPILEPSAGRGAIVRVLRAQGHTVLASDLYDHGAAPALGIKTGVDFLSMRPSDRHHDIVMNPPFKDADRHVRHALGLLPEGGKLAVLLRMAWMAAKRRADLLARLERQVICGRLRMPPADTIDKGVGGMVDFAWLVFGKTAVDDPLIVRA